MSGNELPSNLNEGKFPTGGARLTQLWNNLWCKQLTLVWKSVQRNVALSQWWRKQPLKRDNTRNMVHTVKLPTKGETLTENKLLWNILLFYPMDATCYEASLNCKSWNYFLIQTLTLVTRLWTYLLFPTCNRMALKRFFRHRDFESRIIYPMYCYQLEDWSVFMWHWWRNNMRVQKFVVVFFFFSRTSIRHQPVPVFQSNRGLPKHFFPAGCYAAATLGRLCLCIYPWCACKDSLTMGPSRRFRKAM